MDEPGSRCVLADGDCSGATNRSAESAGFFGLKANDVKLKIAVGVYAGSGFNSPFAGDEVGAPDETSVDTAASRNVRVSGVVLAEALWVTRTSSAIEVV